MKNKWLAAGLNILPGVGYLYLGVRTPFAVILLLLLPAVLVAGTADPAIANSPDSSISWGVILILAIPALAFVVDAFNEAKAVNQGLLDDGQPKAHKQPKASAVTQSVPAKPVASTAKAHESNASQQLFLVSIPKFITLSLLTFTLYLVYWNYQNWKLVKAHEDSGVSPFWRSIFSIFFIYSLLKRMQNMLKEHDPAADLSPTDRTVLYVVLSVIGSLFHPLYLLSLLMPFVLMGVQKRVNAHLGRKGMPSSRLTAGEWGILLLGLAIFALSVFGQLHFTFWTSSHV